MQVVIVGGGIMGLSAGWALARRGHGITVLEQSALPNPRGASVDPHRLIRFPDGAITGYARMVQEAFAAGDRLWADLRVRLYVETGCLGLSCAPDDWAAQACATMDRLDHPYRRLTPAAAQAAYPHLDMTGVLWAFETDHGGPLFAQRIVEALAAWLGARGVTLRERARVAHVDPARARVRLDTGETIQGDAVVIAAGPWLPRFVPAFAERVTPSRQVVVSVEPPAEERPIWERTPILIDLAPEAGFSTVPPAAGTGMKIGDQTFSLAGDPDGAREPTAAECERLLGFAGARFRHFDRWRFMGGKTCYYSVADGEAFILERSARAWIMTGFSGHGFKFGALMREGVADGIEGRRSPEELAAWAAGADLTTGSV